MTARTDKSPQVDRSAKPKDLPLPRRPSYERVVECIEQWISSSGLQKPT
jgi:hypothetical protein